MVKVEFIKDTHSCKIINDLNEPYWGQVSKAFREFTPQAVVTSNSVEIPLHI